MEKSKNLYACKTKLTFMTEQVEDIIKVSSKGQIVIPREVRKKLGVRGGEKLLVLTRDGDILLRKTKELSLSEIGERIDKVVKEEHIDVDKLVAEAVEWARKSK
jgi:antitoxin PrlF